LSVLLIFSSPANDRVSAGSYPLTRRRNPDFKDLKTNL
jgi:hypothetical protein